MKKSTFKNLRQNEDLIKFKSDPRRVYTVIDKFNSGKTIEIVRYKIITPSTLEKWSTPEGNSIEKIDSIGDKDTIKHKSSGILYRVELISHMDKGIPRIACIHMQQVDIDEASKWEVHVLKTDFDD